MYAIAGDNELYIAGGDHFGASVCSMYKWSPEDNHFEDMAVMQIARKQWVTCFYFLKSRPHLNSDVGLEKGEY